MFKKIGIPLLFGCLVSTAGFARQDPQQDSQTESQSTPQVGEEPAAAPAPAVRVPGQAGSQQELDAWKAVLAAQTLTEKAAMAEDFLKQFPESGLTPNAHYLIAMNYYQQGQVEDFIRHAELALSELPRTFDLLSHLAFYYAEMHQPDKAIDRANSALAALAGLEKPVGVSADEWVNEMAQVKAEVNYALGRAYLERSFKGKEEESTANLQKAIGYFQTALAADPQHDFANFRMAAAVRNTGDVKKTLMYYGRCVAIGGAAAGPARQQIEEILKIVNKSLPDSEWAGKSVDDVVAAARLELLESVANAQAERDHQIQLLRDRDAVETTVPSKSPTLGGPDPSSPPPGP